MKYARLECGYEWRSRVGKPRYYPRRNNPLSKPPRRKKVR